MSSNHAITWITKKDHQATDQGCVWLFGYRSKSVGGLEPRSIISCSAAPSVTQKRCLWRWFRSAITKVPYRKGPPSQMSAIAKEHQVRTCSASSVFRTSLPAIWWTTINLCDLDLCSSTQFLLHQPRSASNFSWRSFNVAAPKIWNTFPKNVRCCQSPTPTPFLPRGVPA